jgi:hypothetical protein
MAPIITAVLSRKFSVFVFIVLLLRLSCLR